MIIRPNISRLILPDLPCFMFDRGGMGNNRGRRGGGAAAATIEYRDLDEIISTKSTYTFSAMDIGTAAADRYVLVVTASSGGSSDVAVSAATIGGVSATNLYVVNSSPSKIGLAFLIANVTSGTTGDVVVTWDRSRNRCSAAAYRLDGLVTPLTAEDTALDQTSSSGSLTLDVNTSDGGVMIGGVHHNGSSNAWTGATEDTDSSATGFVHSTASSAIGTGATPKFLSVTTSGSINFSVAAAISLR
jgi:hypothetical protein